MYEFSKQLKCSFKYLYWQICYENVVSAPLSKVGSLCFFFQFGIATSYVGFAFCTVADRDNSYFFATAI